METALVKTCILALICLPVLLFVRIEIARYTKVEMNSINQTSNLVELKTPKIVFDTKEKDGKNLYEKKNGGRCICPVFDDKEIFVYSNPIFAHQHPAFEVETDERGKHECNLICISSLNWARGINKFVVCSVLEHDNISVYDKECNSLDYTSTKITDDKPLCCHEAAIYY